MIQSPIAVATDGYISPSPFRPLSIATRGYILPAVIAEEIVIPGGGGIGVGGTKRKGRKPQYYDRWGEFEKQKRRAQLLQEDEEIAALIVASMIYGILQ